MGHSDRESWIEKVFSTKEKALSHAKGLSQPWFEDRNQQKDPKLKLFGPGNSREEIIGEYSCGYGEFHADPMLSVVVWDVE